MIKKKGFRAAVTKARRLAAAQARPLRIMFADEARFGRMNRPRPCWAPKGVRPEVPCQLIREFTYLYGAVCPKDGTCVFLILPAADTECFQIFLDTTPSNRWMQCTTSSRRRRSTSNVIEKSSNPSLPSPISSSHHDMEVILEGPLS